MRRSARRRLRPVRIGGEAHGLLAYVLGVYQGSNGDATMEMYKRLDGLGVVGVVAVHVFRAQKCSDRAKAYRGGTGGVSYRSMAYERKSWSLQELAKVLDQHADSLGIPWGWAQDPKQPDQPVLLYVDLPTGQVSWHGRTRGPGPAYAGEWDRAVGQASARICRWVADVLAQEKDGGMKPETFYRTEVRDDGETEVEVEFLVESWGSPESGLFGPPEDYDPGEGPEVSFVQAHLLNPDGSHADEVALTDAEKERMLQHFLENPPEPEDPYDD